MDLVISDMTVKRGSFQLGPITLTLQQGVCALIGPNGAGKTTLLSAAAGLIAPATGTSTVAGTAVRGSSRGAAMRALGYLPQNAQVSGVLRVREAVAYAAWLKGMPGNTVTGAVEAALARVDLADHGAARVGKLSGGQRQRVCIAQAIVHDPRVLLLDEPSVGLDPMQRHGLYAIIDQVAASGAAVLVSTHNMDDVTAMSERVVVLKDGMPVADREVDRADPAAERFTALNALVAETMGYRT